MRRSVALLALSLLSWSQLVGLRCDMDGLASESGTVQHAPTTAHHHPPPSEGPPAPHGGHGGTDACLMVLACGAASARPATRTAMVRALDILLTADFSAAGIPIAVETAVDTPPPRLTV